MESKYCPRCKESKPIEAFAKNSHKKDGRQTYCRDCKSKHDYSYYRSDTSGQKRRVFERNDRIIGEHQKRIWEYLLTHPCIDCSESDPVVLDFDHVRGEKSYSVSHLINRAPSWDRILEEIAKCEVRCANCHRRKTAKQFGWYKRLQRT